MLRTRPVPRLAALALAFAGALALRGDAELGKPAPAFSLTDAAGKVHRLADYRGKFVVLEWTNYDCPFVKRHYASGNMQALQKEFTAKGVIWLSINSSAPGKQGNYPGARWLAMAKERGTAASAILLDGDGTVGRLYGAKTTPHLFIVDPQGALIYAGGIDDHPSADASDPPPAANHVRAALGEAMAGKPVSTPFTRSYGCSVKY